MPSIDAIDLPKKYNNTYIRAKQKNDVDFKTVYVDKIVVFEDYEDDRYNIYCKDKDKNQHLFTQEDEFIFDFPPVGVVPFGDSVAITSRYPARQWKKAACHDNFIMYSPLQFLLEEVYEVKEFSFDIPGNSVATYEKLFNGKYYSLQEAVNKLNNNEVVACAINDEFFLTNSHYNDSILVWKENVIAAEYLDGEFNYITPLFKQEVQDLFRSRPCQMNK